MRSVALGVAVLMLVACSKKESADTPQPEPSAVPSTGTAVTSKSAVPRESAAPVQAEDDGSEFEALKGVSGRLFPVGNAVVACGGQCTFPSDPPPQMQIVENGVVRDAPELWPANAWADYAAGMKKEGITSTVSFSGEYPKQLFARGWGEGRTGEGNLPSVKFFVKYWVNGEDSPQLFTKPAPPPREYDEALLTLPTSKSPTDTFTFGGGGPLLGAEAKSLWIREAKDWVRKIAPWGDRVKLWRLASGGTLALQGAAYLISKKGEISELKLPVSSVERVVNQGGVAYLIASNQVLKPKHPERFKLAPPEERVAGRSMTFKKPGTEDAGVDGAAAPPSASLEAPGEFSDQCKTPVVVITNSGGYLPRVGQLADLLRKHADQALSYALFKVTFISGQRYLARASDVASAKRFLEWANGGELKAELKCVDIDAMFPSGKDERLDRVFIHPWSGVEIELP
ncbi:MAG: hypothetical protein AB7S68_31055 [Polyangiaceae bacterium]